MRSKERYCHFYITLPQPLIVGSRQLTEIRERKPDWRSKMKRDTGLDQYDSKQKMDPYAIRIDSRIHHDRSQGKGRWRT